MSHASNFLMPLLTHPVPSYIFHILLLCEYYSIVVPREGGGGGVKKKPREAPKKGARGQFYEKENETRKD